MHILDGLSHQEIATILNIAPHSSSSQLARAKVMLRRMLKIKTLVILVLALVGVPIYQYFKNNAAVKREPSLANNRKEKEIINQKDSTFLQEKEKHQRPSNQKQFAKADRRIGDIISKQDTTQVHINVITDPILSQEHIAENRIDTIISSDSIAEPKYDWKNFIVERNDERENRKWYVHVIGPLGTTLAQNVNKVFMGSDDLTSDSHAEPEEFSTWEEFAQYLPQFGIRN